MNDAPKKKMSKGCLISIIAAGVALVIAVLTLMYLPGMVKEKMEKAFAELETKVIEVNPPDYTTEEIQALFSGALMAFDSGWVSSEVIKSASQTLLGIESVENLNLEQAIKVIDALKMMNAQSPNAEALLKDMGPDSTESSMGSAMDSSESSNASDSAN